MCKQTRSWPGWPTPRGDRLHTYGRSGLRRWPIRPDGWEGGGTLQVGPPQLVEGFAHPRSAVGLHWDSEGKRLALTDPLRLDRALIMDPEQPADRVEFESHPGITSMALSADGRWLAAGAWQGDGVKVWDRATRQTAAWSARQIRLVTVDTQRTLATLTPSRLQSIRELSFSPDGALLAAATYGPSVQLWDLRHIGEELAARHFDWDLPANHPSRIADGPSPALAVHVLHEKQPPPGP